MCSLVLEGWGCGGWALVGDLSKNPDTIMDLFIYLGFYFAFNTVQVISRRVVGRAEETSTYSSSEFCTVNCRPIERNYQVSHLRTCRELNPGLRGGRRECYHSATVAPIHPLGNPFEPKTQPRQKSQIWDPDSALSLAQFEAFHETGPWIF